MECGIFTMEREKVVRCEGIKLPNGEVMKEVKFLGIFGQLEFDKVNENEMKKITIKEYKRKLRLILKSKPDGKNKITAINAWAVALLRY